MSWKFNGRSWQKNLRRFRRKYRKIRKPINRNVKYEQGGTSKVELPGNIKFKIDVRKLAASARRRNLKGMGLDRFDLDELRARKREKINERSKTVKTEKIKAERDMKKLIKEAEEREKLKNELDDMIPKGDDKDKDTSGDDTGGGSNIVQGPNPGDAGGTSTYSSSSSSPSTGQSVGPVGAPVSVTYPSGPNLTNR